MQTNEKRLDALNLSLKLFPCKTCSKRLAITRKDLLNYVGCNECLLTWKDRIREISKLSPALYNWVKNEELDI